MKFTIKSEKLEHKDQIIELDFSQISVIEGYLSTYNKYEGKSVWGEYLKPSRIDGHPLFLIDTTSLDREEKISKILK